MSKEAFVSIMYVILALTALLLSVILLNLLYNLTVTDHSVVKYELSSTDELNDTWRIVCVRNYWADSIINISKYECTFEQVMEKVDVLNEQLKRQPGKETVENTEQ